MNADKPLYHTGDLVLFRSGHDTDQVYRVGTVTAAMNPLGWHYDVTDPTHKGHPADGFKRCDESELWSVSGVQRALREAGL